MKTKDIERALVNKFSVAEWICSLRAYVGDEKDFLTINKNMYLTEYEIKVSRSDFKKDMIKAKHKRMKMGQGGYVKRFYFVVPEGLVQIEEVPAYAGLIYVRGKKLIVVKSAKFLKCKKVTKSHVLRIYRSMMYRFLKMDTK